VVGILAGTIFGFAAGCLTGAIYVFVACGATL